MTQQSTVIGVFEDRTQAAQAIDELRRVGFSDDQVGFMVRHDAAYTESTTEAPEATGKSPSAITRGIVGGVVGAVDALLVPITGPADASSILGTVLPVAEEAIDRLPYPGSEKDTAVHTRPDAPMTVPNIPSSTPAETSTTGSPSVEVTQANEPTAGESGREGILTGGIIGGVLGAAAALLIPGVGPVIAGGILGATLGGAAIGGIAGGFLSTFTHMGVPEEKARYYEQEFQAGRTLVTIKADDRQQKAIEILQRHGAQDVQTH